MRTMTAILLLLALAGCTNQHLGKATGTPFALNPGQWTPTEVDLDVRSDD